MPLISWNDTLSIGVEVVDGQHKKMIEMVNELHAAMKAREGYAVLNLIFMGLADYTKTHFSTEEDIMLSHEYPEYAAHKKEHEDLIAQVAELRKRADRKELNITIDLLHFLRDWVKNHIMNTDKKLGNFLNSRGIK